MGSTISFLTSDGILTQKSTNPTGYTDVSQSFNLNESTQTPRTVGTTVVGGAEPGNGEGALLNKKNYSTATATLNLVGQGEVDLNTIVDRLNKSLNVEVNNEGIERTFSNLTNKYNRFKTPIPNIELRKAFSHVFFTRPACNILTNGSSLNDQCLNNLTFANAYNSSPDLVKELDISANKKDQFMKSLSNMAKSFSLTAEEIETDTYGRTYTGYKISYGKNNIASKTAGSFQITYDDDRNLHVYRLHKLWVDYINNVYRGEFAPKKSNIFDKILDYVCSVYYIMTAEDGETILFWSKYYGVYPSTIPSDQYSWTSGQLLRPNDISVTYQYSFKEDYNPYSLIEFNHNAKVDRNNLGANYVPIYDSKMGTVGTTWVGTPFIEMKRNTGAGNRYDYKLRFAKS